METLEDLGKQSPAASHPELLDWLSVEFMERGWKVKELQRMIGPSATYRQASKMTPELKDKDIFNRLLARGPRFRVEGELVRDVKRRGERAVECEGGRAERVSSGAVRSPF